MPTNSHNLIHTYTYTHLVSMLKYAKLGKVPFSKTLSTQEAVRQQIIDLKNKNKIIDNAAQLNMGQQQIPHTLFSYEVANPTYTYGRRYRSKVPEDEKRHLEGISGDVSVLELPRGGHTTYHGPGQLMMFPVLDLQSLKLKVRDYICILEKSIASLLQNQYGIDAEQRSGVGLNGVWIRNTNQKIAFVGITASRSVTQHGLALNVDVDPFWFRQIVPCNLQDVQVVSIAEVTKGNANVSTVSDQLASELASRLQLHLEKFDGNSIES